MAKCPNCGKIIDYLVNWVSGEYRYRFDGDTYEGNEFVENGKTNDYECPECNETLFCDEEEARKFLSKKEKGRG